MANSDNALFPPGPADAAFEALQSELDAWRATGRTARFWWRDDDAVDATDRLERLLDLTAAVGAVPGVAVIPTHATEALAAQLEHAQAIVMQHGIAHRNRAPADRKKTELTAPTDADRGPLLQALEHGATKLADLNPRNFRLFLVPPWNRIDTYLVSLLPSLGFVGLSTFRPRPSPDPAPGLAQVNCHADPVDWRAAANPDGTRPALAPKPFIDMAREHLAGRRAGRFDPDEPTGLLTHHLAHDEPTWAMIARFAELVASHPAARWDHPDAAFGR